MAKYKPLLEANNLDLTAILTTINNLPSAAPPEPELPPKGTPLGYWSWEQLIALANSDLEASEYFAVGDTKELTLSTGDSLIYVLGDFNLNTITGTSRKAKLAFTPHPRCLNTVYTMNDTNTNAGGWDGSRIRNQTMAEILSTFPPVLTAEGAIKYVDVVSNAGGASTALKTSSDRLRIHSLKECGLSDARASVEGTTYAYYAAGNRVKTVNGTASNYYTRSAMVTHTGRFMCISPTGAANIADAGTDKLGIAPCFDL